MNIRKLIIIVILAVITVALIGCGNYNSWSGTMISNSSTRNGWTISARTLRGHSTRTINLNAENLDALRIDSKNEDGAVTFTMTQGVAEKVTDISGEFNGSIDTSEFDWDRYNCV